MTDALTGQALLRAVLDEPGDDAVRLVMADWLEESGELERGEFVRVQLELAKLTYRPACDHRYRPPVSPPFLKPKCPGCRYDKQLNRLRRRERQLLLRHGHGWLSGVGVKTICHDGGVAEGVNFEIVTAAEKGRGIQADFRRGFVDSVCLPLADFLEHAGALFASHPITRVEITDRGPQDYHNNDPLQHLHGWHRGTVADDSSLSRHSLPDELWLEVARQPRCEQHGVWADFRMPDLARGALSAACVAGGRLLAGLPPA